MVLEWNRQGSVEENLKLKLCLLKRWPCCWIEGFKWLQSQVLHYTAAKPPGWVLQFHSLLWDNHSSHQLPIKAIVSLLNFSEELRHVVFCTSINIFVKQLRALQNHLLVAEEKDNGARFKKGLGVNNIGSYYMCQLLFNKRVATLVYFPPTCFTSSVTKTIVGVFCEIIPWVKHANMFQHSQYRRIGSLCMAMLQKFHSQIIYTFLVAIIS